MVSIFEQAGFELPKEVPKAGPVAEKPAAAATSAKPTATQSIFSAAGFDLPGEKPAAQKRQESNIPKPFTAEESAAASAAQPSTLQKIRDAIDPFAALPSDPFHALPAATKQAAADVYENFIAAAHAVGEGYNQLREGKLAPSLGSPEQKQVIIHGLTGDYPTTQTVYPNASAGGVLKTAGGIVGIPGSIVTGATNALVTRPLTELSGNPEFGERAGFLANALVPIKGVPMAIGKVAPSTHAVNDLVEAIRPENVPELVAGMRANPRMTAADLSDPVRLTTQGLRAGGTSDVQEFISHAVKNRADTRLEAANTAYTDAMGSNPNVVTMVEGLKERARQAGREAIQPALENAKPVNVTPVIEAIDKELKPGLQAFADPSTRLPLSDLQQELLRFKQQLTDGSSLRTDPQLLHDIQSKMGDYAYQLSLSADGKTRHLGSELRGFNEKLIDQIDEASGGAYRPARQKFKDAKDIHQAFDDGFDVLKNRAGVNGLQDRPEALREWMKTATPEEVVAKRIGVRADIDQKINGVKNGALAGQTVAAIPYNQAKLKALFGDKEATRLVRVMDDAKREADTNYAIVSASKTAETKAAADRIKVRDIGGGNPLQIVAPVAAEFLGSSYGIPGVGAMMAAAKGAHMLGQKIGQMHDISRNLQFAQNALATGPAGEETINALLSHPKVISELKKRANALVIP